MNLSLVGPLFVLGCWLISLRRTPWSLPWLALAGVWSAGDMAVALRVETERHFSAAGLLAIQLPFLLLAAVCVAVTESDSSIQQQVAASRSQRRPKRRPKQWTVTSVTGADGVSLYIECGTVQRHIGKADPLADMDGFMDLRARAEQAAETMNALKVKA